MCCTVIAEVLQFTTEIQKSHRQLHRTVQLVYEDPVLFVTADFHVTLRGQQHPKCVPAIRLVYPPFFSNNALRLKTKI